MTEKWAVSVDKYCPNSGLLTKQPWVIDCSFQLLFCNFRVVATPCNLLSTIVIPVDFQVHPHNGGDEGNRTPVQCTDNFVSSTASPYIPTTPKHSNSESVLNISKTYLTSILTSWCNSSASFHVLSRNKKLVLGSYE